jgi:hypothetical protein
VLDFDKRVDTLLAIIELDAIETEMLESTVEFDTC